MAEHNKYDIFISYRRVGGAQYARILQLMLIQRGYKVFLDYDELTDGVFSDKIRAAIKDAPVFMIVLSKGSMERCANDGDWVREEITLAVDQQKHIVPINPDNGFDGFPKGMPERLKETIGSHQHSEISFGQALGATIDFMIKNRLVPTLGERVSNERKDSDFDAAKETLRKIDAHNRFMKRLGITCLISLLFIVIGTCFLFWNHQKNRETVNDLSIKIEKKYADFKMNLSPDITITQMNAIDDIMGKMVPVIPDTMWMSQFELTKTQWYGIMGGSVDETEKNMPMTEISYGDICMIFLDSLRNMTNIEFDLPSADEWEFAARGGKSQETTLYVGDDEVNKVAWYKDNSGGKAHPSDGQQGKDCNSLDLYDMSGNVSEICNTPFISSSDGTQWTICGGNYNSPASEVTISSRAAIAPDKKDKTVGVRLIIRLQ